MSIVSDRDLWTFTAANTKLRYAIDERAVEIVIAAEMAIDTADAPIRTSPTRSCRSGSGLKGRLDSSRSPVAAFELMQSSGPLAGEVWGSATECDGLLTVSASFLAESACTMTESADVPAQTQAGSRRKASGHLQESRKAKGQVQENEALHNRLSRERLRMRSLFIALAIALAAYATRASELGYVEQNPPRPPAEVTTKDKGQLPAVSHVDLARAAFPEAKRRFLEGLPEGYELRVTAGRSGGDGLIVVEKIEKGWITGHWYEGMARPTSDTRDVYTFSEDDVTDWVIKRPNGVIEGNFGRTPLINLSALEQRGTGKTCDLAKRKASFAGWSEAKKNCDALSARVCRNEELWFPASCELDTTKLYQVVVVRSYACCV